MKKLKSNKIMYLLYDGLTKKFKDFKFQIDYELKINSLELTSQCCITI